MACYTGRHMQNIIIAEDDSFLSEIVAVKLHEAGYGVVRISDGDAVVPIVKEKQPAMLLLDLDLPHRQGFSILEEIRNTKELAELPVIIFTNNDEPEIKKRAKELNATYFMKALTGSGELVQTVTGILQ